MSAAATFGIILLLVSAACGATFHWSTAISGNWTESSKWDIGMGFPNDMADEVFVDSVAGAFTVSITEDITVGRLELGSPDEAAGSNATVLLTSPNTLNVSQDMIVWPGASFHLGPGSANKAVFGSAHFNASALVCADDSTSIISGDLNFYAGSSLEYAYLSLLFLKAPYALQLAPSSRVIGEGGALFLGAQPGYAVSVAGTWRLNNTMNSFSVDVVIPIDSVFFARNSKLSFLYNFIVETRNFTITDGSELHSSQWDGPATITVRSNSTSLSDNGPVHRFFVSESYLSADLFVLSGPAQQAEFWNCNFATVVQLEVTNGAHLFANDTAFRSYRPGSVATPYFLVSDGASIRFMHSAPTIPSNSTVERSSLVEIIFFVYSMDFGSSIQGGLIVRHNSSFIVRGPAIIFDLSFSAPKPVSIYNNSKLEFWGPGARILIKSSEFFVSDHSSMTIAGNSYFSTLTTVKICNHSAVHIIDHTQWLIWDAANLTLCDGSSITVDANASIELKFNNPEEAKGVDIFIDETSLLTLQNGGSLSGVGKIYGRVANLGGTITYSNASQTTELFIGNLTQGTDSSLQTYIFPSSQNQTEIKSTTVVKAGSIHLGGAVIASLNTSDLESVQGGLSQRGVVLLESLDLDLEGDTPNLIVRLSNGTEWAATDPHCGYSLQRGPRTLSMIFDISSCSGTGTAGGASPTTTENTPALGGSTTNDNNNQTAAIAGGIVGAIFAIAIIAAIVIMAVPSLRRRVMPYNTRRPPVEAAKDVELEDQSQPLDGPGTKSTWKRTDAPGQSSQV